MNLDLRSALILLTTLLLGALLGGLGVGALQGRRLDSVEALRRPMGFAHHLETIIRPRDAAQADTIRVLLEATAARNATIMRSRNEAMRAELAQLQTALAPLLDAEQRERLAGFVRRGPPPGPRGGPGDRRGPPPTFEGGGPPPSSRDRLGGPPPEHWDRDPGAPPPPPPH